MLGDGEVLRYSRSILLESVGMEGQARLKAASVLVVGAGGLGSVILPILAGCGVGKIGVIDGDALELHNLQRQSLYKTADIGGRKAELCAAFLRGLNPLCDVLPYDFFTTSAPEKFKEIALGYDAIIDATDGFNSRLLSNEAAVLQGKPLFTGAATGFVGHAYGFFGSSAELPCYACVFGGLEEPAQNCANAGIFAPVLASVGGFVAADALKFLAGVEPLDFNKFIFVDFLKESAIKVMKIQKDRRCKVCLKG